MKLLCAIFLLSGCQSTADKEAQALAFTIQLLRLPVGPPLHVE